MKHETESEENNLILPRAAYALVSDADLSDLRVLIYSAACEADGNGFDTAEAATALGLKESEVRSSVKFWRGAGVFKARKREAKKISPEAETARDGSADLGTAARKERTLRSKQPIRLTGEELCRAANEDGEIKRLIDTAEQVAGWIFNTAEIEIVASLYTNLKLSPEYILGLIGHYVCQKEKPLRYAEKVAYDLVDRGICTAEALEEHLKRMEIFETNEGMVRRKFGIGQRELTSKEKKLIEDWFLTYSFGEDMITLAFERTVNAIGKASVCYAGSILKAWYESGARCPDDVLKGEKSKKKPAAKKQQEPQSFDVDSFFERAIRRSYEKKNDI